MVLSKKLKNHWKGKHIERKYHLIHEVVQRVDIVVEKIPSMDNLAMQRTLDYSIP